MSIEKEIQIAVAEVRLITLDARIEHLRGFIANREAQFDVETLRAEKDALQSHLEWLKGSGR